MDDAGIGLVRAMQRWQFPYARYTIYYRLFVEELTSTTIAPRGWLGEEAPGQSAWLITYHVNMCTSV